MSRFMFTSLLAPHTKVTEEQLATEEGILSLGNSLRAMNRRRFLSTMAAASAVATVACALDPAEAPAQTTTQPSVVDVLNFALNLEFLEAEFYAYGSSGMSLAQNVSAGNISSPPSISTSNVLNPPMITLTGDQQAVAAALMQDEAHHIAQLQAAISTLSGTAITEPQLDYSAGGTMPAVTTNLAFFAAARQFTAVGNSAYAGAAADLISQPNVLQTAGQILGAEAQHLGTVNYLCVMLGITPATDKQLDAYDVPPDGTAQIFTITPQTNPPMGMAAAAGIARTPQQVLGIVYGISTATTTTPPTGTTKGGFYPDGMNGNITST